MERQSLREQFKKDGYVVIKKVLTDEEIARYKNRMAELAADKKANWTLPDGVNKEKDFWPIIFNERILAKVREIFGSDVKYLQHNDLHVGFSSFSWHRDSVNREFGIGPDWEEEDEPYELARVGLYLQDADSGFKLGLIKGTHRPDEHLPKREMNRIHSRLKGLPNLWAALTGRGLLHRKADWVATEPGDAIIFDPRILHTGGKFKDVKYSFFIAYGLPNKHFFNHYNYYRHLRSDLQYQDYAPELKSQLQEHGLYADEQHTVEEIEGAWLPSAAFTYVAKRFK
ncbi:MAG: phytanoyl-CoA dioxygenase family protein [Saprospiraceae bacterium]|nr:phytanoyl-CoA dioxygenase family protein [Saprospiraceae bacterium]MCB0623381.1 phytanoyl-CoA dioxygenase family protein [Saprospiraceae bacterium]MCB0682656.1 phytanoyl-CoA dioxygenase family protein [Saprospiraceae bacterium]